MRARSPGSFSRLKPELHPAVRYRREREGALLFDGASLNIYVTNLTGLMILKKINGRASCAEIVAHLQRRFASASARTLRRDLRSFLNGLQKAGLVELQD